MRNIAILSIMLSFTGCSTIEFQKENEAKAHAAAEWIAQRSGFIENAVMAITHVAVYSSEADTAERQRTIEILHAIAGNLNTLIANGVTDPDSIRAALKIKEPYFGPIMTAVSSLVQVEMETWRDNGYTHLAANILIAVSKGIASGTVTE